MPARSEADIVATQKGHKLVDVALLLAWEGFEGYISFLTAKGPVDVKQHLECLCKSRKHNANHKCYSASVIVSTAPKGSCIWGSTCESHISQSSVTLRYLRLMFLARMLLGAPGIATRNKKLLATKGIPTRSKDARHSQT